MTLALTLVQCQSATKKITQPQPLPPAGYEPEKMHLLTKDGSNRFPFVSQDEMKMLYVSADRKKHSHSQIYVLDFSSKEEKRVTFQNGHLANPQFDARSEFIIYESTTDEEKELPQIIGEKDHKLDEAEDVWTHFLKWLLPLDNFEIYRSDLNGQRIERLTNKQFFDGQAQWLKPDEIIYSSKVKSQFKIRKLTAKNKRWMSSDFMTSPNNILQININDKNRWMAMVEADESLQSAALLVQSSQKTSSIRLFKDGHHFISPSWHPTEPYLLLTTNIQNSNNFELMVFDLKAKCLKQLTFLNSQEIDPHFGPDGTNIYFSSDVNGKFDIFRMKFRPPEACLDAIKTANIDP